MSHSRGKYYTHLYGGQLVSSWNCGYDVSCTIPPLLVPYPQNPHTNLRRIQRSTERKARRNHRKGLSCVCRRHSQLQQQQQQLGMADNPDPQGVKPALLLALHFKYIGVLLAEPNVQIHAGGCWLFLEAMRASIRQHHPGRIESHARMKNMSIDLQLQQTGDETGDPRGRYRPARCRNLNSTGSSLLTPNLGFVGPAPPGVDKALSPHHESFHTSTTPTNRGRKRWSPVSTPPSRVWKPQLGVCIASAIPEG